MGKFLRALSFIKDLQLPIQMKGEWIGMVITDYHDLLWVISSRLCILITDFIRRGRVIGAVKEIGCFEV